MSDLGSHILVARILSDFSEPTLRFAEFFAIDWGVAPTAFAYVLLARLESAFGAYGGAKAYLAIWVALLGTSVAFMARSLGSRDAWLAGLLALPLAFSWFVWMGFLPFITTLPLFAFTLGVWWWPRDGLWKLPVLWVLLTLLFGFHIIGLCAAAGAIGTSWLWQRYIQRDSRPPSFLSLCVALLPAVGLVAAYLLGPRPPSVGWTYLSAFDQAYSLFTFTWGTLTDTGRLLLVAWVAGVIAATTWKTWRGEVWPRAVTAAVALVTVGVVVPVHMGAIFPAGPRLFPFALMLCVASLRWSGSARRVVPLASMGLLAALCVATTLRVRELDRDYRGFVDLVASIAPGSRVLPIFGLHLHQRHAASIRERAGRRNARALRPRIQAGRVLRRRGALRLRDRVGRSGAADGGHRRVVSRGGP
jgi:hypothetical protein